MIVAHTAADAQRRKFSAIHQPHTRIPTESELVETYEVARSTARRAVKALRDEGLVYTVPQRGTYVAQPGESTQQAAERQYRQRATRQEVGAATKDGAD